MLELLSVATAANGTINCLTYSPYGEFSLIHYGVTAADFASSADVTEFLDSYRTHYLTVSFPVGTENLYKSWVSQF